jgi:hypothetical protein
MEHSAAALELSSNLAVPILRQLQQSVHVYSTVGASVPRSVVDFHGNKSVLEYQVEV